MIKVTVTYSGGEVVEVKAGPRARVELERHFDVKFPDVFGANATGFSEDRFYYLAFAAERFAGHPVPEDYDEWLDTVDDVDVEEVDAVDPTRRVVTPAV